MPNNIEILGFKITPVKFRDLQVADLAKLSTAIETESSRVFQSFIPMFEIY